MILEKIQSEISRFIETYGIAPNTIIISDNTLDEIRKELPFPVDMTEINTMYGLKIINTQDIDYYDYKICLCLYNSVLKVIK